MRIRIFLSLMVLALAACATAATEAPPLPTVLPTLPPADDPQTDPQQATPTPEIAAVQPTADAVQPANPEQPEGAAQPPDTSAEALASATEAIGASIQQAIGMLPPPGTAVAPVTEEAVPGAEAPPFFEIFYQESGGPSNSSLSVVIYNDGRVLRNDVETRIPPEEVAALNQRIQEVNFFGIQGQFTMPGAGSDVYSYLVRIELEDGSARMLDAHDRTTPPELLQFFSYLRSVGT